MPEARGPEVASVIILPTLSRLAAPRRLSRTGEERCRRDVGDWGRTRKRHPGGGAIG